MPNTQSNRWVRCTLPNLQIEALFKLVQWLCRGMKSTWLRLAYSVKYYFEAEPHRLRYEAEPRNEKEVVSFQRKQKSRSLYYQLRRLGKGSSRAQHTSNRWVRCTLPNLQIEVPSHQIVGYVVLYPTYKSRRYYLGFALSSCSINSVTRFKSI